MLIDSVLASLESSQALAPFFRKLDEGKDASCAVSASPRAMLIAAEFKRREKCTLAVCAGESNAKSLAQQLKAFLGRDCVYTFPEREDAPFNEKPRNLALIAERCKAMWALQNKRKVLVVASARALLRALPPKDANFACPLVLHTGQDLGKSSGEHLPSNLEQLQMRLIRMGYLHLETPEGPGTFSVRGGTLDIFCANMGYPVRLDFFDTQLEEIRRFLPSTGQSIASLESVEIYPAREFAYDRKSLKTLRNKLEKPARSNPKLREILAQIDGGLHGNEQDAVLAYLFDECATLGDYIAPSGLICLLEPRALFDDMNHAYEDLQEKAKRSRIACNNLFMEPAKVNLGNAPRAMYVSVLSGKNSADIHIKTQRTEVAGAPEKLIRKIKDLVDARNSVVLCAENRNVRQSLKFELIDSGISILELCEQDTPAALAPEKRKPLKRGVVNLSEVNLPLGFILKEAKLALISIYDTQQGNARPYRTSASTPSVDITEISFPYAPGDYVVHSVHGIARFAEVLSREIEGVVRDYCLLEYAENDRLFVPVEQLDRITRYVGADSHAPRLTRLGTADWSRHLRTARAATRKLAFDLVDVYARRSEAKGFCFGPDTAAQQEMEADFPFQETPDQTRALAEIKADMRRNKPMDRLLCGDVGFGKTELALRCAFLATQYRKQVMVLCPTTILAQQHFTTFSERCEPYGVRCEVLSRFKSPAQQQAILKSFAAGELDILIGTHRLLSPDVNPCDLGLVIIDEEQRFGVGHKEQLKNLKESVDVLTLSATPIPRTMQMAISGIRDLSLLLSPPAKRRAVEVYVGQWDSDVVGEAIARELARKGQIYYVSNRVNSLEGALERVQMNAGHARIGLAHGQMNAEALERVMEEFSAGRLDILLSTTIIESGIDNPHTNTLIIEDAHRLGLAQLYQLKGRIGRSSAQAYAYFMFPEAAQLSEEAYTRLAALAEHSDLGSGMRIALRDLEIRGAGSLLGAEQSGNMSAVGFDLFASMLADAVCAAREGKEIPDTQEIAALSDITVNISVSALLPEKYLPEADTRIRWYRRIAHASTVEAVEALEQKLEAEQGKLPPEAKNLFMKARIRAWAAEKRVTSISLSAGKLTVEPISVSSQKLGGLRKSGARYVREKGRFSIPSRYFTGSRAEEASGALPDICEAVFMFLHSLSE